MIEADIDSIVFAQGANPSVTLFGKNLPYKHGIANIDPRGDRLFITIRKDEFREAQEKTRRPWWQRLFFPILSSPIDR